MPYVFVEKLNSAAFDANTTAIIQKLKDETNFPSSVFSNKVFYSE